MTITRELTAPAMSCGHCKMTIEKAVKALEGISSVNADPATKKVVVEYDESSTTINDIKKAIEGAGYEAEIEQDVVQ
jgi:copper ion binding protein